MRDQQARAKRLLRPTGWRYALEFAWISMAVGFALLPQEARSQSQRPITFEFDIQPILTRYGCNSGPCHGKSRGQNGFALSLLGFDADMDHSAIVQDGRGRRVFPSAPEQSLLLRKATGQTPHGGGKRFGADAQAYRLLRDWIADGLRRDPPETPKLLRIVVTPGSVSLAPKQVVSLRVTAEYSDGARRDVTEGSAFQSNDNVLAAVKGAGVVTAGSLTGETAIMARYQNNIAVANIQIPLPNPPAPAAYDRLPRKNYIDDLVWKKLAQLGVLPAETASDTTFLRRVYLRIIGRLPTPEETRAFLADTSHDKRQRMVARLLERPEYADFWANKWVDLLRPNPYRSGIKATFTLDRWVRQAFRENLPYDRFARELIAARGSTWRNGATVVHRDRPDPVEMATSVSQLFLGIRLECAKCHHHPFEVWGQDDFYGFAAFFSRVGHKGVGLSPPISGGEEMIFTTTSGTLYHGRTGKPVNPKTLFAPEPKIEGDTDPRDALVDWMLAPGNPYFATVMANRIWAELMGQGIVDPVDDLRATNPPSNGPLLEALAKDFREQGYDIKKLIHRIATSAVFERSSVPNEKNAGDLRNFSRYYRQRMRAEPLLDAIVDITGVQETYAAHATGTRATQLWTHRASSLFLDTFGRPDPNQDPPCERTTDPTVTQVLHLMNAPRLNQKLLDDSGRVAKLAKSDQPREKMVEELYLLVYCRKPTADEMKVALAALPEKNRRQALEDLLWALLNTPEFLFID